MPICNTAAMNQPPERDQQPSYRRCPCPGDPRRSQLAQKPRARGARQHHLVAVAALQPRAQPGRADLALSALSLARQRDISGPEAHHGRLRDCLAAVRGRPRFDPLALRGRLRSRFALPVGGALSTAVLNEKYSRVREFTEIRISPAAWACDPAALWLAPCLAAPASPPMSARSSSSSRSHRIGRPQFRALLKLLA